MDELVANLSALNFVPHGYCYLWRPDLLFLHAGSDILIALAYYSIPLALYVIWKQRQDLQFGWLFKLFAAFIFACGTTHLISIWNIWNNDYYLEGVVKLVTALISLMTAVLIWPLMPRLLALPSPAALEESNLSLNEEVQRRKKAEFELRGLYQSLEQKVADRTRELEQAKQALELQIMVANQAQKRLHSIIESVPNGIIVINREGEILQANGQAQSIFRYEPAKLQGRKIEHLVPKNLREQHCRDRDRFCAAPEKRMMGERKDLYGLCDDGSLVPVEIGLSPVEGSADEEIVASIVDISERKQYERRIESRNAALERSNRELQEFAFIASHDLREPLRKIISFSKLLLSRDYGQFTSEGEEFAGYVVSAAERMRELLDSLLSYSRVTSKGESFQPTDLNGVISDVLSDLQLRIEESGADIQVDDLGILDADTSQIRQLLQNVLANSLKYRSPDRPCAIRISGAKHVGDVYEILIEDNGIGFEPEYAEQIFEVFKRLHGRQQYPGTGMGLAICRKIVERHQGRIWAEGCPGEGASFHIELPVRQQEGVLEV